LVQPLAALEAYETDHPKLDLEAYLVH
jgi:hypothetical protein